MPPAATSEELAALRLGTRKVGAMQKILLGTMACGLILSVLSGTAMAQSAYERYPDPNAYQRYPDQSAPRYPSGTSSQAYPDRQYPGPQYQGRPPMPPDAASEQAYRDGYRAGWWAGRRGQNYDDRRPDYRGWQDYRR
jgi:hypothetical protein